MEGPIPWSVLVACVIAVYMVLSACEAQPRRDLEPVTDVSHQPRSLALDSLAQRVVDGRRNAATDVLPWYTARNDERKSVAAGYQSPEVVQSVTWRRDSQHQVGNRFHDHYRETTWTRSYREQVR